MRYGIFSDIHSNLEALDAVIQAYQKESIDKYLCIGDVVGYAANPNECVERIKELAEVTVAGNHDWASVGLFSLDFFNPEAAQAILWTEKNISHSASTFLRSLKLLYEEEDFILVHGSLNDPGDFNYMNDEYIAQRTLALMNKEICFVGHTHFPGTFIQEENQNLRYSKESLIGIKRGNKYIINVGSVGQPRDANPTPSYGIFDSEKKTFELKRVPYDSKETRKKIYQEDLPLFFGERLLKGR
ncbi:MAG: metallophosphoesterase family protein [Candidatus Omnitrophica bacterium]|nr:metallophosphoesterase family protein [Candidatus Omnitrophota bacterium]MDD5653078.1 metallophosphoesterase family protein [Candidatus Omnitrophota bacterium]